jgi:ribosomal protein S12 methylthiotransferase
MRYYIVTLGCPKNQVDSEMMASLLGAVGHKAVDDPRRADLLIANTCGFIEDAREESYLQLRELAKAKSKRQLLIAAGCMAQRYGDVIRQELPEVDAVIGARSWPEIVPLVAALQSGGRALTLVREQSQVIASVRRQATMGASAYVKIADGCDAACAFCAIPLIKGRQQSKPQAEIVREAQELVAQDVRELILIAQDSTRYGHDLGLEDGLPDLLRAITQGAPELDWLRVMYAYPGHVSERLIATMAELPQVCHYIDIPLQHGHPEVLRRMRRPHDTQAVFDLVERLREAMPDIALRSAMIVGYPGETDDEFEELLAFMDVLAFDKVGVFAFSSEEGTAAAALLDPVASEIIADRYRQAMELQQEVSMDCNAEQVGRTLEVLIDGADDGMSVGRSYRDAPEIDGLVLFTEELPVGELVAARITGALSYDLLAELA